MRLLGLALLFVACNAASPVSDAGTQCLAQVDCARACANVGNVCSQPSTQVCSEICQQVQNNCAASCAASTSPANAALFGCFQQNSACAAFTACVSDCTSRPVVTPIDLGARD
jgi:hypothetical protein